MLGLLKIVCDLKLYHADVCILQPHGKLINDYRKYTDKIFSPVHQQTLWQRVRNKLLSRNIGREQLLARIRNYDVVILNTILALDYFSQQELDSFSSLTLCTFEMPVATSFLLQERVYKLSSPKLIFSPTPALSVLLKQNKLVKAEIMPLNQYVIPDYVRRGGSVRQPSSKFRIGMMGMPAWAKGMDYFLCIAQQFFVAYPIPDLQFVLKGIPESNIYYQIYSRDIHNAGLEGRVVIEGKTPNIGEFYETLDVLALTSREDTCPNIMIEAALFKVPTICFEHSGGAEPFVQSYGGYIIPFLDIGDYCNALNNYYEDRKLLEMHGMKAREYALVNHCDQHLIAAQFNAGMAALQNMN